MGGGGGERVLSFGIQINEERRNRRGGGPTLEITLKIGMVCFVLTPIPYCSTKPFNYVFGSCFRMLAVILVSDFYSSEEHLTIMI